MADQLIPFLTASILLTLAPGPDIIYVLVRSIAYSAKQGIVTAIGLGKRDFDTYQPGCFWRVGNHQAV